MRNKLGQFVNGGVSPRKGKKHSEESKLKMSVAKRGKKVTQKTRKKMSDTRKRLGIKPPIQTGKNNWNWKGNKVSYRGLHHWIESKLNQLHYCEHCKKSDLPHRHYQWANIDHKYKRNLKDWIRLCAKCHTNYDEKMGFRTFDRQKNLSTGRFISSLHPNTDMLL